LEVKISDISKIRYQTKLARTSSTPGYVFITVGALAAFFVAPLISIDYNDGSFNPQRYYNTAALVVKFSYGRNSNKYYF